VFVYEFLGFCSGVAEYFIPVGYDAMSLGSDISFCDKVVASSHHLQGLKYT
jgi:hypothetical protein